MKNIYSGYKSNACKWIPVVVSLALFGFYNQLFAVTYGELNAQRAEVGLPSLTGNHQFDFQMLARECNGGIRYSCVLARQLQGAPQQNLPMRIPVRPPASRLPSSSSSSSSQFECNKCRRNVKDCWESQKRMKSAITGSSMATTCSTWETTCNRICNQ